MPFCTGCGNSVSVPGSFCSKCGQRIARDPGRSSTIAQAGQPVPNLLGQLRSLGVKESVLTEAAQSLATNEALVGAVTLGFRRKLIFTTGRVISVSAIPLVGSNFEWGEGMRLERHGGNFQIHYPKLAALVFAPSRVRGSHGSVQGHEVLVGVIKKVGPSISKSIWPYELQFISAGSTILNRVYGVTTSQGQEIMEYATKVGLTIRKEQ